MSETCDPKDIALKSFFLGPQAENRPYLNQYLQQIFRDLYEWRQSMYPNDGASISDSDQMESSFQERTDQFSQQLTELTKRFRQEIPKFSPRYIGHMFSDISLPALLGNILALIHNPNNVSGEASKVGIEIENEAIKMLSEMISYPHRSFGHFTSGGTIANFEALVRARSRMAKWISIAAKLKSHDLFSASHMGWKEFDRLREGLEKTDLELGDILKPFNFLECNAYQIAPTFEKAFATKFKGPVLLVPKNKHYSWKKGVSLLGLGNEALWEIDLDRNGALCLQSLKALIEKAKKENRPILAVVSVAGTTELGEIDPVDKIDSLLDKYVTEDNIHIWHHVDGAYGAFFCSMIGMDESPLSSDIEKRLSAISKSNSVTIDPHKLGYVPYASGAFLCRDQREYTLNTFAAPYIDFSHHIDKGPFTLEGSRAATGATATWLTSKVIGLNHDGYGRLLKIGIRNKNRLEEKLLASPLPIRICPGGDTNIICFVLAESGAQVSSVNKRSLDLYERLGPKQDGQFIVSKTTLKHHSYKKLFEAYTGSWQADIDTDSITLLRVCLMNPFFDSKENETQFCDEFVTTLSSLSKTC